MSKNEETQKEIKNEDNFNVGEALNLEPKALPLVITPKKGEEFTPEQQEYANVINGYAYKNPKKFAIKKEELIANLRELKTNPDLINKLRGGNKSVVYDNKLISNKLD